jgi:DNA polymerase III subunit epsilon
VLIGDCRFTAIDFESAGAARGCTETPVQIGLAHWQLNGGYGETFHSYLATNAQITWSARKVHGIRDEDLIAAPALLTLWPELKHRLTGAAVVAHGKGTEKRFLRAFPGHGFGPWVDTLLLGRAAWPDLPDHSLSAICDARELSPLIAHMLPNRRWHDALYDAVASLVLLEDIIATFDLPARPLEWLLRPNTAAWHRKRNSF